MRFPLTLALVTMVGLAAAPARADEGDDGIGRVRTGVPNAVTPVASTAQPSLIDPGFATRLLATGSDPLENPSGLITAFGKFGTGVGT